ncbi:LOW QUALITY PROTEIN: nucleolar RNA helicase 2 [Onychostoma macrolepis]|uniref:LOW QUALITY PROTEIN: nucleolar RNA helicase 2 n=1 Tax=Onychostoma macrolepis TaxID=369639 RepID=UPI00272C1B92|nr:LOW QUALITY PROTEIN: nucleolar RNA helicase 2 [Onychostoma macrolepis]
MSASSLRTSLPVLSFPPVRSVQSHMSICSTTSKMPSKILPAADQSALMEEVESGLQLLKKKKKKTKERKQKAEAEAEECDAPAPKRRKAEKMPTESTDMNGNTDTSQLKLKKKKKANVEDVTGNGETDKTPVSAVVDTPGPSSEDSDSDREKETPEQKEGAFSNFRISQNTIKLLQARGVSYLFDIQVKTFNSVYDGKDVIGQARTGTGKTFSFAVPLVEKLQSGAEDRRRGRAPKVLVLAPTRELAIQVAKDFKDVTRKLSVTCFYGGSSYNPQMEAIRNGIDILVGTPGRIRDHLQNNKLDLSQLKHVVLDEVDQMLDMGFAEQVEEILSMSYKKDAEEKPQTLLFSATCPSWVYDVAKKYMRSQFIHVDLIGKRTQKAATTVEHLAIACHWSQRASVIGDVVQVYSGSHGRTIVFCETKREATELSMNTSIKQSAQSLHGDIPQKQREITLKGFRNGTFEVLVATNVAARGLDIPEVDLVIQCSPPNDVESYIHRSGRTGRAGRTGVCICFYQRKEESQLKFVEQKAGITFKRVGVPTANDIIQSSSKDAMKFLDSVPAVAVGYFREAARELIEQRGAEEALAAALAHISGATSLEQRSLISSDSGFTTMILNCSQEMHNIGYAWRGLKEQLGEGIDEHIKRMTFLKGKMGVCFDIPANKVKEMQEQWQDSRRWQLSVATELPDMEQSMRQISERMSGGFGGRGGGRGRRSFGFRGGNSSGGRRGGGGGGGGAQKRSFSQAFDY